MNIKSLTLRDFRNYEDLEIEFDRNTNILFGNNGQGKTNILEAVYLAATTTSHRGSKDREMIRFGCDESHIRAVIEKDSREHEIDIHLKKNKTKGIAVDKVPVKKASDMYGTLKVVVFSPEDLSIIKNGPAERRRFLNTELCQLDRIYLHRLGMYNKVLEQRTQLLKDLYNNPDLENTLEIWDEQLVNYGSQIIESREEFVEKLNEITKPIHSDITAGKESLEIIYEKSVSKDDFARTLKENRERDKRFCQTHAGPHRDDLCVKSMGTDMRKYGSQGQQRTSALSLKLAEIELIKIQTSEEPVLLLDDVLSELDSQRQELLLKYINNIQTLITCTGMDDFVKNRVPVDRIYEVTEGRIKRVTG
ncbi:MAG: DNA replication/repair protein RecF [Eubacterium sp.]|nr:DNA replication/repair protein RecF [Eubacterium sp.]